MKNTLLLFLSLVLYCGVMAQNTMPPSLKSMVAVTRSDYSHPNFLYGIKPLPGTKDSKMDIVFRTFTMVYQIGYVKHAEAIPEPSLFIGFYGFTYPVIGRLDTLWSRPGDTTAEPCVHNLLADVFVNGYEAFEASGPQSCKLLVFDLSKNPKLAEQIAAVVPVPAAAKGLFYFFWDTRIQPSLPAGFKSANMAEMEVEKPVKFPVGKTSFALAKSSAPAAVAKPAALVVAAKSETPIPKALQTPPAKPNVPTAAQKAKLEAAATRPSPQAAVKKTETQTQPAAIKPGPKKTAPAEVLVRAPEISRALYPEFMEFALKQTPLLDKNDILLALSKKNDTLFAVSKSRNQVVQVYPLPINSYPVKLRVAAPGSPLERLYPANIRSKMASIAFSYKGQTLYFSDIKISRKLQVPALFSNRMEIKGSWENPVTLTWDNEKQTGSDTLYVTLNKVPLSVSVIDGKTNVPVTRSSVTVFLSGKTIDSRMIRSNGEFPDLFSIGSIYNMSVGSDDYDSLTVPVFSKDFDDGKTISLKPRPAYDVFYVAATSPMRNQMIESVESKFESVLRLHQPFYLFVSNTDKPLRTTDEKSFKGVINNIIGLFEDPPNLGTDADKFNKEVVVKPASPFKVVNLNIYMSKEVFQYQEKGKQFIDDIVYNCSTRFNVWVSVYIYLDCEITPQLLSYKYKDGKPISKYYHFFSLLNE